MSDTDTHNSQDDDAIDGFDMLDGSIDDLADFVPFEPFPVGDYRCQFSYEFEKVGEKELPAVKVTLLLQEVISMTKPDAVAPEEGRKCILPRYILKKKDGQDNDMGQGQLKKDILIPLNEVFNNPKPTALLAEADGCSVVVTLGVRKRKNKETDEIYQENILRAMVVDA